MSHDKWATEVEVIFLKKKKKLQTFLVKIQINTVFEIISITFYNTINQIIYSLVSNLGAH